MALQTIKILNNPLFLSGTGIVMKISLVISFFFHVIILLTFQRAFPLNFNRVELRTYRVELIRPPVEDMDSDDLSDAQIEHLKQKERFDSLNQQDTISLDTKDKRYITYARLIKGEIMRHWRYPPIAREHLIEGNLTVIFSLTRDGEMTHIRIMKASGYDILDKEVIRAIRTATPFPPFPGSVMVKKLNIKAAFDYRLTAARN